MALHGGRCVQVCKRVVVWAKKFYAVYLMGIMTTTAKRKKKSQTMIGTDSTRVTTGRFFCYSMIIGRLTEASVAETAAIHP